MPDNFGQRLVSVIMNCLNCQKYLREAIDSVYSQTYQNWEIIFWDNASTDKSGEISRSYGEKVRYFRELETITLFAARNKALQKARGEYIAFLDCDDVWLPRKLEKQIPLFIDSQVGIVFCDVIYFNDKGESEILYSRRKYRTGHCFSSLLSDFFLSQPAIIIRRSALNDLTEWYDPRLPCSGDADLFLRIAYKWHLAMVNEPLAKWRLHAANLTSKRGYLVPEEFDLMLAKYLKLYPNFTSRYNREIRCLKILGATARARYFWEQGESHQARNALVSYIFSSTRALIYYLMTFFPRRLAKAFINRLRAIRIDPATDQ